MHSGADLDLEVLQQISGDNDIIADEQGGKSAVAWRVKERVASQRKGQRVHCTQREAHRALVHTCLGLVRRCYGLVVDGTVLLERVKEGQLFGAEVRSGASH